MKRDEAVQAILGADFPEPTPLPSEEDALAHFSQRVADAAKENRDAAANELVGQLGMKASTKKSIKSFDGSPLFGNAQKNLF